MSDSSGSPGLKHVYKKSLSGARWGLITQLIIRIGGFASSIVLARLLTATDYGLVGMASTVAGIVALVSNFGLGQALLQTSSDVEKRSNQTFWINSCVSLVFMAVQFATAPLVAEFYGTAELTGILRVTSFGYLLAAFGAVSGINIQKSLNFKTAYKIETISSLLRIAMSVLLAVNGFSYWSIIYADLLYKLSISLLNYTNSQWRPSLSFNFEGYKKLFKFGQYVYLSNLLNYMMNTMDFIILGKLYGPKVLGPYFFAYNLVMLFHQISMTIIGMVTMPSIVALKENEAERSSYFLRTLSMISITSLPLFVFFVVDGQTFIHVFYGERWADAVVPFMLISVFGAVRGFVSPFGAYSQAMGDSRTPFYWHLVFAPIMVIAMFISARQGVYYAALCTGIFYSICYITYAVFIARVHRIKMKSLFGSMVKSVMVIFAAAGVVLLLHPLFRNVTIWTLAIDCIVYAVIILFGWKLFSPESLNDIRKFVTSRKQS